MKNIKQVNRLNRFETLVSKYKALLILLGLAVLIIAPFVVPNDYFMRVLCVILMYCTFGFGLNILLGEMGLMSLGQAGFVGAGAFTTAVLLTTLKWNFIPATLCGALVAAILGLIIGLPTLRLHGSYLAIVTIGFGEIMRTVFLNWTSVTGGPRGIKSIPRPSLFGFEFNYANKGFYFLIVVTTILVGLFCAALHKSKYGRAFATIKQDELAATLMGIETTRYKVIGFMLSAAISGLMGGYYAMMQRYIDSNSFISDMSVMIVSCLVIGGAGTLRGPVLGAILLVSFPEIFRDLQDYRFVFYGLIMIIMMVVRPAGLLGWDSTLPYQLPRSLSERRMKSLKKVQEKGETD